MSTRLLVCGSIAFDTIMTFSGQFQDHLIPEQLHAINLSFETQHLQREFGGCAGNIAYSVQALGLKPVLMGTIGKDGESYIERLKNWGCDTTHIRQLNEMYTPQAFITTDRQHNQMTFFYPGAMNQCHINHVQEADNITLAVVAPQGYDGMVQHVKECYELNIPCLFDPGQGLPLFDQHALNQTIDYCTWLIVNEYESTLLEKCLNRPLVSIAKQVEALIITRGEKGSDFYFKNGEKIAIPAVPAEKIVDPTGCGDAFRAGLLFGLLQKWPWLKTGRLASILGAIKVSSPGAQNHLINLTEIEHRYSQLFNESLFSH